MQLVIAHRINAPLALVEATLLDPERVSRCADAVRTVASGKLLRFERGAQRVQRSAQFMVAESFIPKGWLSLVGHFGWVEEVEWDLRSHQGDFVITPELPDRLRRRVECRGNYRLETVGDQATLRVLEATLTVRVPVVGRVVEDHLQQMLEVHFEDEAHWIEEEALERWNEASQARSSAA